VLTYQFVLPEKIVSQEFLEDLAYAHGGFTSWKAEDVWVDGTRHTVGEAVRVFQVSTVDYAELIYRVRQQAENAGEQALYFGQVGEHRVIDLRAGGAA